MGVEGYWVGDQFLHNATKLQKLKRRSSIHVCKWTDLHHLIVTTGCTAKNKNQQKQSTGHGQGEG